GSFTLKTLKALPSTAMESSVCVTLCGKLPRTESYFKRCARVFASLMSLTATNLMSLSSSAVRTMLRPMRPKPLMPTLMGILPPMNVTEIAAVQERVTAAGEVKMLGCAWRKVNAGEIRRWISFRSPYRIREFEIDRYVLVGTMVRRLVWPGSTSRSTFRSLDHQ